MRVVVNQLLPKYPNKVLLQWNLDEIDPNRVSGVLFSVQRSGSPGGEWETRATGLDTVFFEDTWADGSEASGKEENLLSLRREYWYRVQAVLADGEVLTSKPIDNEGTLESVLQRVGPIGLRYDDDNSYPDPMTVLGENPRIAKRLHLINRAVMRKAAINLRYFFGAKLAVLKKRHFGTRCPVCVEPFTKEVLISNCNSCYGTGWTGGYYPAIVTYGRFMETTVAINVETEGKTNIQRAQFSIVNFPRFEQDDVIVEVDNAQRWVVNDQTARNYRRHRVTQEITVTELARTSVAYRVPVEFQEAMPNPAIEGPTDLVLPAGDLDLAEYSAAFSAAFRSPTT